MLREVPCWTHAEVGEVNFGEGNGSKRQLSKAELLCCVVRYSTSVFQNPCQAVVFPEFQLCCLLPQFGSVL